MLYEGRESTGKIGESIARKHYAKQGYFIIAKNFYNHIGKRQGEIDFVAQKENLLVFVEVKNRTNAYGSYNSAIDAMHNLKQRRLIKAVHWFIALNSNYADSSMRIDLCVVLLDKSANYVRIISNAVEDLY